MSNHTLIYNAISNTISNYGCRFTTDEKEIQLTTLELHMLGFKTGDILLLLEMHEGCYYLSKKEQPGVFIRATQNAVDQMIKSIVDQMTKSLQKYEP